MTGAWGLKFHLKWIRIFTTVIYSSYLLIDLILFEIPNEDHSFLEITFRLTYLFNNFAEYWGYLEFEMLCSTYTVV